MQEPDEVQGPCRVLRGQAPSQGGAEVVLLGVHARQPLGLVRPAELVVRAGGHGQEVAEVARPQHVEVLVLGAALDGEVAHRVEQPVPRPIRVFATDDQRLVDEPGDQVQDVLLADPAARAHRFDGVQAEPTGEDRKAPEQAALWLIEQPVGPVDRRPQRSLARRHVGGGDAAQQAEAVRQPLVDLGQREDLEPARGQLDRERQPVEAAADPDDKVGVRWRVDQSGCGTLGARQEQPGGVVGLQRLWGIGGPRLDPQGGEGEHRLGREAKRLAAGRYERDRRACLQERAGHLAAGVEKMLAVVEDQQRTARPQATRQG